MQKVNIKVKIIPDFPKEREYNGLINNEILSYKEKDTKVDIDLKKCIVTREDNEKIIIINYDNEVINLSLKGYNYEIDIPIEKIKKDIHDKYLNIKYRVEDKIVEYILEYEVI